MRSEQYIRPSPRLSSTSALPQAPFSGSGGSFGGAGSVVWQHSPEGGLRGPEGCPGGLEGLSQRACELGAADNSSAWLGAGGQQPASPGRSYRSEMESLPARAVAADCVSAGSASMGRGDLGGAPDSHVPTECSGAADGHGSAGAGRAESGTAADGHVWVDAGSIERCSVAGGQHPADAGRGAQGQAAYVSAHASRGEQGDAEGGSALAESDGKEWGDAADDELGREGALLASALAGVGALGQGRVPPAASYVLAEEWRADASSGDLWGAPQGAPLESLLGSADAGSQQCHWPAARDQSRLGSRQAREEPRAGQIDEVAGHGASGGAQPCMLNPAPDPALLVGSAAATPTEGGDRTGSGGAGGARAAAQGAQVPLDPEVSNGTGSRAADVGGATEKAMQAPYERTVSECDRQELQARGGVAGQPAQTAPDFVVSEREPQQPAQGDAPGAPGVTHPDCGSATEASGGDEHAALLSSSSQLVPLPDHGLGVVESAPGAPWGASGYEDDPPSSACSPVCHSSPVPLAAVSGACVYRPADYAAAQLLVESSAFLPAHARRPDTSAAYADARWLRAAEAAAVAERALTHPAGHRGEPAGALGLGLAGFAACLGSPHRLSCVVIAAGLLSIHHLSCHFPWCGNVIAGFFA